MGISLITSAMQFFLLFYYTNVARINSALAGSALMVGKLTWEAINDPLFGYLPDHTRSRFGWHRIYMLLGAVPLGIAAWIMVSLPKGLTGVPAFLAELLSFWLVDTFHTMTTTPYYALTPEDFRTRTHLKHHSFGGIPPVMSNKPPAHKTPIQNLWFIGAQSESTGGVLNAMTGAKKVVKSVLRGSYKK